MRFVCIDSTGERKTGKIVEFLGIAPLKYGQRATPNGSFMQLVTNSKYIIKYTTDGSEPKENGGLYNGEFLLPQGCKYVRTAVFYKDHLIEEKDIQVDTVSAPEAKKIDLKKPLQFRFNSKKQFGDTESSYTELANLCKLEGVLIKGAGTYIYSRANRPYSAGDLQALIDLVRDTCFKNVDVVATFEYKELMFLSGELFNQWIDLNKLDINELRKIGDIKQ